IGQQQHLAQSRAARAFALAASHSLGPVKHIEKERIKTFVRQIDGTGGRTGPIELRAGSTSLVDRVKQHFGNHPPAIETSEILAILLIGWRRNRVKLIGLAGDDLTND